MGLWCNGTFYYFVWFPLDNGIKLQDNGVENLKHRRNQQPPLLSRRAACIVHVMSLLLLPAQVPDCKEELDGEIMSHQRRSMKGTNNLHPSTAPCAVRGDLPSWSPSPAGCRVRNIENKFFPTIGTMYQDICTRYKQQADIYP